jgi:alpha-ribazole phosphatase
VTRLVVCRHAEAGNRGQACALADELAHLPLEAVYTSPLERAIQTARAIAAAHGLAPIEVDALREIDFGQVDGLVFDEFPVELQAGLLREPLTVRFPGGETYEELRERVCRAIEEIVVSHPDAVVAVVTHAGSIRAALATWLGIADESIFRIDQSHAAVNVVDWIEEGPLIRLVNGAAASIPRGALRRSMRA